MKLEHSRQASARTLSTSHRSGAALLIVLALVVLLTALAVAVFSRATIDRQVSYSSSSQSKAELLARGALAVTIGDLKQEIAAGSTIATVSGITIYSAKPAATPPAVVAPSTLTPFLVGSSGTGGLENLLKRSAYQQPFYANPTPAPSPLTYDIPTYPVPNRAAGPSSQAATTVASQNGRSISLARWNKPLLLQKATPLSDTDITPVNTFTAPDWILIARDGSNPTAWNANLITSANNASSVVGRYAYTIYDEGGLIDMNVAGNPTVSTAAQVGRKGAVAYADLKQIPGVSSLSSGSQTKFVNNIVGWRNFSSAVATGSLGTFASGSVYAFASGTAYYNAVLSNANGFLLISNSTLNGSQSDRMFSGRQQLIKLLVQGMASTASDRANLQTALRYLGTFSRELNRPSWKPSTPTGSTINYATLAKTPTPETSTAINRDLSVVRVSSGLTGNWNRADGSPLVAGEQLIKRRFALPRINNLPQATPAPMPNPTPAAVVAVKRDFGLLWNSAQNRWDYIGASGDQNYAPGVTVQPRILDLDEVAAGSVLDAAGGYTSTHIYREPNFFELLKAVILSGSVGLGSGSANTFVASEQKYYITGTTPSNLLSADYQIMQIGANIIDDWDSDNVPTFINFAGNQLAGIENLPYLNKLVFVPSFPVPLAGGTVFKAWLVPSLWNPHQNDELATGTIRVVLSGAGSYTAWGIQKDNKGVTITTHSTAISPLPQSMDLNASGFGVPTPPADPNHAPIQTNPTTGVFSVSPPGATGPPYENFYGFNFPFTGQPNETLVTQPWADSAWPDFGTGGMKLELQIQIPGTSTFIPYQTWNIAASGVPLILATARNNFAYNSFPNSKLYDPEFVALDPRTLRFGIWGSDATHQPSVGDNPIKHDMDQGAQDSLDEQPPANRIEYITLYQPQGPSFTVTYSAGSTNLSLYATNGPGATNHYVDLDLVQRRGDWTTDASGTLNPTTIMYAGATPTPTPTPNPTPVATPPNAQDRPQILSAPFQSVAELGQVFRDQPWKTLAFSITNSGDAGLLDAFTLQDVSMTAGRTSLNTRQSAVLTAILSQATKNLTGTSIITTTQRDAIVTAIIGHTVTASNPMINKGELVTWLAGDASVTALTNKEARECVVRAFSDACQTRTWNLMIDVIAQSGRYPPTATGLANFVVEGEKRYWLHVAIDRFTGEIIDQQLEAVYE